MRFYNALLTLNATQIAQAIAACLWVQRAQTGTADLLRDSEPLDDEGYIPVHRLPHDLVSGLELRIDAVDLIDLCTIIDPDPWDEGSVELQFSNDVHNLHGDSVDETERTRFTRDDLMMHGRSSELFDVIGAKLHADEVGVYATWAHEYWGAFESDRITMEELRLAWLETHPGQRNLEGTPAPSNDMLSHTAARPADYIDLTMSVSRSPQETIPARGLDPNDEYQCHECESKFVGGQLAYLPDAVREAVPAHQLMPAGLCPNCESYCYALMVADDC